LLRSDVATSDVQDRVTLIEYLFRQLGEERLAYGELDDLRGYYRKLAHPDIAEQIRPLLLDGTKSVLVRQAAIHITEACELEALEDDLVNIALDPSQLLLIRINAAHAVARAGHKEARAKLKPLVTGEIGDDPDDQLS
jgi:hypothetical protein